MSDGIDALTTGPIHGFEHWPTGDVPRHGAAVYTVWDREGRFIYVGMSGRGYQGVTRPDAKGKGAWGRLDSHASGRRSGDQFCVIVGTSSPKVFIKADIKPARDARTIDGMRWRRALGDAAFKPHD